MNFSSFVSVFFNSSDLLMVGVQISVTICALSLTVLRCIKVHCTREMAMLSSISIVLSQDGARLENSIQCKGMVREF